MKIESNKYTKEKKNVHSLSTSTSKYNSTNLETKQRLDGEKYRIKKKNSQ